MKGIINRQVWDLEHKRWSWLIKNEKGQFYTVDEGKLLLRKGEGVIFTPGGKDSNRALNTIKEV